MMPVASNRMPIAVRQRDVRDESRRAASRPARLQLAVDGRELHRDSRVPFHRAECTPGALSSAAISSPESSATAGRPDALA